MNRIRRPIRRKIRVQTPSIGIDDWIIETGDTHISLWICTVSEDSLNAGAIVHGEVETGNSAVTPANYCDTGDVEMVEDCNCVSREVVVVECGEVYVGAASFSTGAPENEQESLLFWLVDEDVLL
jgi:hypothetical protein